MSYIPHEISEIATPSQSKNAKRTNEIIESMCHSAYMMSIVTAVLNQSPREHDDTPHSTTLTFRHGKLQK